MAAVAPATTSYTLEQAEQDIANLVQQVDLLSEALTQNDGTVLPNTPAASSYVQFATSAYQRIQSGDGNTYDTCVNHVMLTSDYTATGTITTLPGMSFAAAAGIVYRLSGLLFIANGSSTAATVELNLNASGLFSNSMSVSSTTYLPVFTYLYGSNTTGGGGFTEGASLANFNRTSSAMATAAAAYWCTIDGCIQVTTACTVNLQLSWGSGGQAFTVKSGGGSSGSYLDVMPVTSGLI